MAKSIRSKVKRRFRAAKRAKSERVTGEARAAREAEKVRRLTAGVPVEDPKPANAFLFPNASDAQFPQNLPVRTIDYRSEANPESHEAFIGGRRKMTSLEKAAMKLQGKTDTADAADAMDLDAPPVDVQGMMMPRSLREGGKKVKQQAPVIPVRRDNLKRGNKVGGREVKKAAQKRRKKK
ncbi:unnamed protein product [Vitrella brassicaformis CCMP3155]|uniref:Uncharacterized protein n=1 Tax=Vitrella brassicaformis (strain CCMP3155) TaxID=1169540 RepID=A0A0G4GFA3_VITBC|nr:unnamed protein product [Vitrella brassicaformis CCMP3155]|eukprot:CEM28189.1 unnamed protein product [Vitrella brassicaformis CCMP3155]